MKTCLPLYILAERNELPEHQFMDAPTLDWIKKHEPEFRDARQIKIEPSVIVEKYLQRYAPEDGWFEDEALLSTIHGQRHVLRCIALAGILCEFKVLSVNPEELCMVAALHDVRRKNDKGDSEHAARASVWVRKNLTAISQKYGCSLAGSPLERVTEAILHHDKIDSPDPVSESAIDLVNSFKLVDALDRYRQPKLKWWIDESYLKIKPDSSVKKFAFDLMAKSEEYFLSGFNNEQSVFKTVYDIL